MNCVIYSRVSTVDQDNQRQIDELKQYAKNNKYNLLKVFEEKITGASKAADRLEFKKLNEFIDKEKVDCLLVWELSRLGRSMMDVLNTIELLSEKKINIYIKKERMNTLDEKGKKSTMTTMLISILSGFAEMERETIRQRSISGIRQNVATGGSGTGIVKAYGFEKLDKKLVINKEESEIIKLIFKKYLSGLGTTQIAKYLNLQKIPTRFNKLYVDKKIKQKFGNLKKGSDYNWKDGTIYSILTNSIYIGERKHKGEVFKIDPIIDEITYNKVQVRLTENYNKKDSNRIYPNYLKDILICGTCGKGYFMHKRADGKDQAYKCISKRYNEYCGNPSIGIDKLLDALLIAIMPIMETTGFQKENYQNVLKENLENKSIEIKNCQKEIEIINKKLEKLIKLHLENEITVKQYSTFKTDLSNDLIKREENLDRLIIEFEKTQNLSKKYNSKKTQFPEKDFKENLKSHIDFVKIFPVKNIDKFREPFPSKQDVAILVLVKSSVDYYHEPSYFTIMISQRSNNIGVLQLPNGEKDIEKGLERNIIDGKYKLVNHYPIDSKKQPAYPAIPVRAKLKKAS